MQSKEITAKEKFILAIIDSYKNSDGFFFGNTAFIASKLGVKANAINSSIRKLLGKKILIQIEINTLKALTIDFSHSCFSAE
jgi:hypothetical protein